MKNSLTGTIEVVAVCEAEEEHESFIVVMSFHFNHKDGYDIIIDVIDDAVVSVICRDQVTSLPPFSGSG